MSVKGINTICSLEHKKQTLTQEHLKVNYMDYQYIVSKQLLEHKKDAR